MRQKRVDRGVGATFGHLILAGRASGQRLHLLARGGALISLVFLAFALISIAAPTALGGESLIVMKRLWTPPFALLIGVPVGLFLLITNVLIDSGTKSARARKAQALRPFIALGRNFLLVYFGSHVLNSLLRRSGVFGVLVGVFPCEAAAMWGMPVLSVIAWSTLTFVLNRKKIYLRA
ncbi:hypothetical protein K0651_06245 [Ornithinimicrobium sp. Arc0846-15]|nr:hypothetical protein [Ornithinimicrobium laminariae]